MCFIYEAELFFLYIMCVCVEGGGGGGRGAILANFQPNAQII